VTTAEIATVLGRRAGVTSPESQADILGKPRPAALAARLKD